MSVLASLFTPRVLIALVVYVFTMLTLSLFTKQLAVAALPAAAFAIVMGRVLAHLFATEPAQRSGEP